MYTNISAPQAQVLQSFGSATQLINYSLLDKYHQNLLNHPVDSYLFNGLSYPPFEQLGPNLLKCLSMKCWFVL